MRRRPQPFPLGGYQKGPRWFTSRNLFSTVSLVVGICWFALMWTKAPVMNRHGTAFYPVATNSPDGGPSLADGWPTNTRAAPQANSKVHVIFSTDCSAFQNWQSYLVFFTAEMVNHQGPITRIASGCSEEEQEAIKKEYSKLGDQFSVHFTPDFSRVEGTKERYPYYNKPGGLKHWLDSPASPPDGTVVALIDPDMVFMRPLTEKIKSTPVLFTNPVKESDLIEEVTEGHPAAQFYGIGDKWIEFNLSYIAGPESPSLRVKSNAAWEHYSIGPPYMVHKSDMMKIAWHWHDFVPRVYEGHPHLLAEMYAYSVASAHLELPHLRLDSYMTSDVGSYGEGWPFVEQLPVEKICSQDLSGITDKLPVMLHYCQRYKVEGGFEFWKRHIPKTIFSCSSEAIKLPDQKDINGLFLNKTLTKGERIDLYRAFQYCQLTIKLNKALVRYKTLFCQFQSAY